MKRKSATEYNTMAKNAAYKIFRALSVFDNEPDDVKQHAEQLIMQQVSLMRFGQKVIIDGVEFKEFIEPVEEAPAEVVEPTEAAGSTEETPAP